MGLLQEKGIRAYQIKSGVVVCPVCATEEEIKSLNEDKVLTEDDVEHDADRMRCDRCKQEI